MTFPDLVDRPWIAPGAHARPMALVPEAEREITRLASAEYPHEACGLLLGREEPERVLVLCALPARNLDQERRHDRYRLDPADHLRIEIEAEQRGLAIVGVWHSHPDHPALPSRTDFDAAWEGWSYLIASVQGREVRDLRAWRLHEGTFVEESLVPVHSVPHQA